jgi:hypothetical protein
MNVQIKFDNGVTVSVPLNHLTIDNSDVIDPDSYSLSEDGDMYFVSGDVFIYEDNSFRQLDYKELSELNLANHAECISVSCSKV